MREAAGARGGRPHLSVVVPVYNEEASIQPLHAAIVRACDALGAPWEQIFVDDGSTDGTFQALEAVQRADSRVTVVRFRRNYGQTAALAAGVRAARGHLLVTMDADLQNDPADIPRLLARLDEGYDVVCGWRQDRKDHAIVRRLPSVVANRLLAWLSGVRIHDTGCSLRAYRTPVMKRVSLYSDLHRFVPALSTLAGARVTEIPVRHHPRRFGASKYGVSRAWRVVVDLVLIKMLTGFAARPAAWFGLLSLPPFLAGGAALIAFALGAAPGVVLPGVALLCLGLGGHLLAMAVVSEMVLASGTFRPEVMAVAVPSPPVQGLP